MNTPRACRSTTTAKPKQTTENQLNATSAVGQDFCFHKVHDKALRSWFTPIRNRCTGRRKWQKVVKENWSRTTDGVKKIKMVWTNIAKK